MRSLALVALFAACATTPPPPPTPLPPLPPMVRAVDRYGTTRYSAEELRRLLGAPFEAYLVAKDDAERKRLKATLKDRFRELGFAWGGVSPITYFRPEGNPTYVTIDVVEEKDR